MPTTPPQALDPELQETVAETLMALQWKHATLKRDAMTEDARAYHAMRSENLNAALSLVQHAAAIQAQARALLTALEMCQPSQPPAANVSLAGDECQGCKGEGE